MNEQTRIDEKNKQAQAMNRQYIGPSPYRIIPRIEPPSERYATDICCLVIGLLFTLGVVGTPFYLANPKNICIKLGNLQIAMVLSVDMTYLHNPIYNFWLLPPQLLSSNSEQSHLHRYLFIWNYPLSRYQQFQRDLNGALCLPSSKTITSLLSFQDQTSNKYFFFLHVDQRNLILAVSLVVTLVISIFMRCCPGCMMHTILFLSAILSIVLGVIVYLYNSQTLSGKIVITSILGITFILTIFIIFDKPNIILNKLFIDQANKLISQRKRIFLYAYFFMLLAAALILLCYQLYHRALTIEPPQATPFNIYYQPTEKDFIVTVAVLGAYFIWGIFCLKAALTICIVTNVIHYIYNPQDQTSAFCLSIKLIFKHLGSIFASAFINSLFIIPASIYDLFRNCGHGKFQKSTGCSALVDLVRSDTLAFMTLTGNPYCNSAKYCDYFWYESMTTEKTQSTLRVYKISANLVVTLSATIAGLIYFKNLEGSILYLNLVAGLVIGTFLIDLPIDVTDAIRLLYLIEQEAFKRRQDCFKFTTNVLSKADQLRFIRDIELIYVDKQFREQMARIRKDYWNIKDEKKKDKKKKKKSKNSKKDIELE